MDQGSIKGVIKSAMRSKGLKYSDLADFLGVSLVTVRRFMSREELGLERLFKICSWLGVSLSDIAVAAESNSKKSNFLTIEQEEFFASFPTYFTFLRLLGRGLTPDQIACQYDLGTERLEGILYELELIKVIALKPSVRITIPWPISFRFPGPLQEKFFSRIQGVITDHLAREALGDPDHRDRMFYYGDSILLRSSSYDLYKKEMIELHEKWTVTSRSEARLYDPSDLIPVTTLMGIDQFDALTEVMGVPR